MVSHGLARCKTLLTAMALAGLTTSAHAADWQRLPVGGDTAIHSFDASKLVFELDEVSYWRRVQFATPVETAKGSVVTALFRERIQCKVHTILQLNWLLYDGQGRLLDQLPASETDPHPIVPDSIGDAFAEKLCPMRPVSPNAPGASDDTGLTVIPRKPLTPVPAPKAPLAPSKPQLTPAKPATSPAPAPNGADNLIVIPGNGEPKP